jgi:hypothetical protein
MEGTMKVKDIFRFILVAHGKEGYAILPEDTKMLNKWNYGMFGGGMGWLYPYRAIVLFQGTAGTLEDWRRNFEFAPCDIGQYRGVHKGFSEEYEMIKEQVHRFIEAALAQGIKDILITGYSQGAATAAICSVDVASRYTQCPTCITYGSPKYLTEDARHKFNSSGVYFVNVVNPIDIVTKVVPGQYRPGVDYELPVPWWKWLIPSKLIVGIADHTLEAYRQQINKE